MRESHLPGEYTKQKRQNEKEIVVVHLKTTNEASMIWNILCRFISTIAKPIKLKLLWEHETNLYNTRENTLLDYFH